MSAFDLTNAGFEFFGSVTIWLNVARIRKDRGHAGISLASIIFFLLWGFWNLIYYPTLDQWASFAAGCSITLANMVWIGHLIYFGKIKTNEEHNTNSLRKEIRSP